MKNKPTQRLSHRDGFTLVELVVVVAIIGLITASAAIRFSGMTRPARLEWAIGRIAAADSDLRRHATRHARAGRLQFDLGSGHLQRTFNVEGDRVTTAVALGSGVEVTHYLSATRDVSSGDVTVDYSPQGTSETFAVELTVSDDDTFWLLFAGVTGQMTRLEEEQDVESLLQTIQ